MLAFMTVAKALVDENRIRILMALRNRELCVCQVTAFLDLAPSTTSKHLSILRQAQLIEARKKGKWVYYSLVNPDSAVPVVKNALTWVIDAFTTHPAICADEEHIQEIVKREELICGEETVKEREYFHSLEIHSLEDPSDS